MDFSQIKFNTENFRNEMPLFEEQVPNFGKLIYDPATDPVFELTQQLTKEYPEKYHQLKER